VPYTHVHTDHTGRTIVGGDSPLHLDGEGDIPAVGGAPGASLVAADATAPPFADSSFDTVASRLTHTDFDRPAAAFAEAARVLRRGGHLSYVGVHPCFVTPFVERHPSGARLLHPGYRRRGWHHAGPGFGRGIRPRVGVHHLPLADLIGVALGTGLRLTRLEEPGDDD
jgi:SAM-dependent methyltransferase